MGGACYSNHMISLPTLLRPDRGEPAATIHLVPKDDADAWVAGRPASERALLTAHRFGPKHPTVLLPQGDTVGAAHSTSGDPVWSLAALPGALPPGNYRLQGDLPQNSALGWLLAQHRFTRYRAAEDAEPRTLLLSDAAAVEPAIQAATATARVRDLIDTPAEEMGPQPTGGRRGGARQAPPARKADRHAWRGAARRAFPSSTPSVAPPSAPANPG